MITIKQIAEAANVSATTVSNVIHGKRGKVSPETIEKIQQLLKENEYVPRFGLSALKNTGSKIIGVLISTPSFVEHSAYERPFYGTVIGTLESELRKRGYYIMLCASKDIREVMRMTLGWNVDGVISISMPLRYYHEIVERVGKPVVSIDADVNNTEEIASLEKCFNVTSKDFEGAKKMVRYLLEQGNEKIIYLYNTEKGVDHRRYLGANEAYREILGNQAQIESVKLEGSYLQRLQEYDRLRKYIGRKVVLFFSTDLNAMEAMNYFQSKGIQIPEDISLAGYDNDIYSRLSIPALTTMNIDVQAKAEGAVNMMMRLLDGEEIQQKNQTIEVDLIKRESIWSKKPD